MNNIAYRVENFEEIGNFSGHPIGPYAFHPINCYFVDRLMDAHSGVYTHPNPLDEGAGHLETSDVCGMSSVEGLRLWFDGFLEDFAVAGFVISTYICEGRYDVLPSGQVVFDSTMAALVPNDFEICP